jgi:RNA recognition motif-containing protein
MNEIIVSETEPDENGIITRTEYSEDENGFKIKTIKKIKRYNMMHKFYNSVIDRQKNWVKFGLAAGDNNVTFVSPEEIFMEPPPTEKEKEKNKNERKFLPENKTEKTAVKEIKEADTKYNKVDVKIFKEKYDKITIKIIGINTDVKEDDLYELFSAICLVKYISIPKDYNTRESRGIAYIVFYTEKDMEICFEKLNNYGYDHLRLKLEKI